MLGALLSLSALRVPVPVTLAGFGDLGRGPGRWLLPAWEGPSSPQSPVWVPDPVGQLELW